MTPGDLKHIGRFMTAGAAVGGGAALLRSLLREISSIKNESDSTERYLPLRLPSLKPKEPTEKIASGEPGAIDRVADTVFGGNEKGPTSAWTYLLGLPAAGLAGGGAYKLTSHLYDKFQEAKLRKRLEQVQSDYQDTLLEERKQLVKGASEKQALFNGKGTPVSRADALALVTMATVPLSGIAAHILTKRYLEKSFPKAKEPEPEVPPVRLELAEQNRPGDQDLRAKLAAAIDDPLAWHMCGRVVLEHTGTDSILHDLACKAASNIGSLEDSLLDGGFAKVASAAEDNQRKLSTAQRSVGLMRLLKSASLAEPVKMLIASEIHDMAPTADVSEYMGTNVELDLLKQASLGGILGALSDLLSSTKVATVMASTSSEEEEDTNHVTKEEEEARSEAVERSLDEFADSDDTDAPGNPDDALVSLLGTASQAISSAGDGVDIAEASVDSSDLTDAFFANAPQTGQDRRTALQVIRAAKPTSAQV